MRLAFDKYSLLLLEFRRNKEALEFTFIPSHLKLNCVRPVYRGLVKFEHINGRLRPSKMWFEINKRQLPYPSMQFIDILRKVKSILVVDDIDKEFVSQFKSMISDFQINERKVSFIGLCKFCKSDGYCTELTTDYCLFQGEKLCLRCAKKELLKELSFQGIRLNNTLINRLEFIIRKFRDIRLVFKFLSAGFDLKNPELTLYDVVSPSTVLETVKIDEIDIPSAFRKILLECGIDTLLPAQVLALKNGLLENKNILVVSATSSGKTLIGELAGIPKAMKKQKMLFLVPLVALANQLYEEFKAKYSKLGLKVAIKVGMSKINVGEEELVVVDDDVSDADIIVATYEGFDFLLRSRDINERMNIGAIVIDEIQMLADEERGSELDGIIVRLRTLYPNAQIIGLSATIGNPEEVAAKLGLNLVEYDGRPVPLERHLVICLSESDKLKIITKLVKLERNYVSSQGKRGQTIVFTNARRKTEEIAEWLKSKNILAATYHAGMPYVKRKSVEEAFMSGSLDVVVTTYALGAGFNAPCSQVIFESLFMGNSYLTNTMFNQMLGRAGRLGMHDRGRVVLLLDLSVRRRGNRLTDEQLAVQLLEGKIENVVPNADFEKCAEQLLAFICMDGASEVDKLREKYNLLLNDSTDFNSALEYLWKLKLIKFENRTVIPTELGKAGSISFLKPSEITTVYYDLEELDPLTIAISLEPFRSAYISEKLRSELNKIYRTHFPVRLFSDAIIGHLSSFKKRPGRIPKWVLDTFAKWASEFFNCKCKDNPYCECGVLNFSKKIVDARLSGLNPSQIAYHIREKYEVYCYSGDIFNWLDTLIHHLKAVKRISHVKGLDDFENDIEEIIEKIENPNQA
ncbi:MAG: DUF5814 domain-containing protein [Candidatus Odinarchaeia archaeon]